MARIVYEDETDGGNEWDYFRTKQEQPFEPISRKDGTV